MIPQTGHWEVESEQTYVVYDLKTGAIAHIHRIITHRGAQTVADAQAQVRALELATRFGHRRERVGVLRADNFDLAVPQRVDVKTLQLSTEEAGLRFAPAKRVIRKMAAASRRKRRKTARPRTAQRGSSAEKRDAGLS